MDSTQELKSKILSGQRLTENEYLNIYVNTGLLELGEIANAIKKRIHPDESSVTFVIDRNINYTNVCSCKCRFCAFYKDKNDPYSYVLDYESVKIKIQELIEQNGTQILLQGGLNSEIKLDYYLNLLENIRNDFPKITIHAFSPPEIDFIARQNNLKIPDLLDLFIQAGLDSVPGGGAEILVDSVRKTISPNKINSYTWLSIMKEIHNKGISSTATMMAGTTESESDIISHLTQIRTLQDETSGFTAFIPWCFYPENTKLKPSKLFTGMDYLKLISISRIILDNIKNIQVSWPTQGIKTAQLGLFFGANDFGGTMLEENVISSTGHTISPSITEIIRAIRAIKKIPAQRSTRYEIIKYYPII